MTALDWGILAFTLIMALWGYAQGLIVGFLSLAGFALGALIGSRVAPRLLEEGSSSPFAPLIALVGALLVGGILASGLELLGFRLRGRLGDSLGVLDGMGGAVLVACLGLALAWVAGAVALNTPGRVSCASRSSAPPSSPG
ncbi:MAG: CvpA family protein [Thermoleophilaceae bacterium]